MITGERATNSKVQPPQQIVENILIEGANNILAGATGSGKSYATKQMLMAIANGEDEVFKNQGTIIVFPSFIRHRVNPVTKGIRYSLVNWFEGPAFK